MDTVSIPLFYRAIFTVLDLLLPLFGIYAHTVAPALVLKGWTPTHASPPAIDTYLLSDALAGFFASLAFLQIFLLWPKPNDWVVWRAMQGATLLTDIFMLGGFYRALRSEGRLDTHLWRAEDYSNIGGYAVISIIRVAFLLGIGLRISKSKRA